MSWNDSSEPPKKPADKSGSKKPNPWGAPAGDDNIETFPKPGSGPKRPSQPPRRPAGAPPPGFDDLSRNLQNKLKGYFGGLGGKPTNPRAIGLAGAGIAALWLATGIYIVQANEQAVITTLGAYSGTAGPGLRYHLPWPVQRVQKVSVTELRRTDVGGSTANDALAESLMLTGDENIVDLDFTVNWRVADAPKYLFNLRATDAAVKDVAESAMREVIGRMNLQDILTTRRGQVQQETLDTMQRTLDSYGAGVRVDEVQIRNAGPPQPVVKAFQEVAAAEQRAESSINEATGQAARIRQEALGYRAQVVQEAAGEAARFNQVYAQYKLAPAVTRERLYIETMQRVLARSNKVVIDSKGASAPIILPSDVFKPRTQTAAPATGAAQ